MNVNEINLIRARMLNRRYDARRSNVSNKPEDVTDVESFSNTKPVKVGHGNTRLPFGLCKKYGIEIGDSWGPKDAWDALAGIGVYADKEYDKLEKTGKVGGKGSDEEKIKRFKNKLAKAKPEQRSIAVDWMFAQLEIGDSLRYQDGDEKYEITYTFDRRTGEIKYKYTDQDGTHMLNEDTCKSWFLKDHDFSDDESKIKYAIDRSSGKEKKKVAKEIEETKDETTSTSGEKPASLPAPTDDDLLELSSGIKSIYKGTTGEARDDALLDELSQWIASYDFDTLKFDYPGGGTIEFTKGKDGGLSYVTKSTSGSVAWKESDNEESILELAYELSKATTDEVLASAGRTPTEKPHDEEPEDDIESEEVEEIEPKPSPAVKPVSVMTPAIKSKLDEFIERHESLLISEDKEEDWWKMAEKLVDDVADFLKDTDFDEIKYNDGYGESTITKDKNGKLTRTSHDGNITTGLSAVASNFDLDLFISGDTSSVKMYKYPEDSKKAEETPKSKGTEKTAKIGYSSGIPTSEVRVDPDISGSFERYNGVRRMHSDFLTSKYNLTEEDKDILSEGMRAVFGNSHFKMAIDAGVMREIILTNDSFKNQIELDELGEGSSGGCFNPARRKSISREMFGTESHREGREFEKYGYCDTEPETSYDGWYGDVKIKFKKDKVGDRVTYTMNDSLDCTGTYSGVAGTSATYEGIFNYIDSRGNKDDIAKAVKYFKETPPDKITYKGLADAMGAETWGDQYLEVQYHGVLTLDDVDEIEFKSEHDVTSEIKKRLESRGIKIKYFY